MKKLFLSLFLALSAISVPAFAEEWALNGFDPVAYLAQGEARPGRPEIVTQWHGKSWHFATEENRLMFEADPRAYAPGFGGFCPVSLAEGHRVPGDPRQFVMIGHRVYLVGSPEHARELMADPRGILTHARRVWSEMGH